MNKEDLRLRFIEYLKNNYTYARPNIMAGNVFYTYNNYIGIDFFEIFKSQKKYGKCKNVN